MSFFSGDDSLIPTPIISEEDWRNHLAAKFAESTDTQINDIPSHGWEDAAQTQIDALHLNDPTPPPDPALSTDWASRADNQIQMIGSDSPSQQDLASQYEQQGPSASAYEAQGMQAPGTTQAMRAIAPLQPREPLPLPSSPSIAGRASQLPSALRIQMPPPADYSTVPGSEILQAGQRAIEGPVVGAAQGAIEPITRLPGEISSLYSTATQPYIDPATGQRRPYHEAPPETQYQRLGQVAEQTLPVAGDVANIYPPWALGNAEFNALYGGYEHSGLPQTLGSTGIQAALPFAVGASALPHLAPALLRRVGEEAAAREAGQIVDLPTARRLVPEDRPGPAMLVSGGKTTQIPLSSLDLSMFPPDAGVQVTPQGLETYLNRWQQETQPGGAALRGGVFYTPGSRSIYAGGGDIVGGNYGVEGRTLFHSPLFVNAGNIEDGFPDAVGSGLARSISNKIQIAQSFAGVDQARAAENILSALKEGGIPDDEAQVLAPLMAQRLPTGEYSWAVRESIMAHRARNAGHDAIIAVGGYDPLTGHPRASELMDLREDVYPYRPQGGRGGFGLRPEYEEQYMTGKYPGAPGPKLEPIDPLSPQGAQQPNLFPRRQIGPDPADFRLDFGEEDPFGYGSPSGLDDLIEQEVKSAGLNVADLTSDQYADVEDYITGQGPKPAFLTSGALPAQGTGSFAPVQGSSPALTPAMIKTINEAVGEPFFKDYQHTGLPLMKAEQLLEQYFGAQKATDLIDQAIIAHPSVFDLAGSSAAQGASPAATLPATDPLVQELEKAGVAPHSLSLQQFYDLQDYVYGIGPKPSFLGPSPISFSVTDATHPAEIDFIDTQLQMILRDKAASFLTPIQVTDAATGKVASFLLKDFLNSPFSDTGKFLQQQFQKASSPWAQLGLRSLSPFPDAGQALREAAGGAIGGGIAAATGPEDQTPEDRFNRFILGAGLGVRGVRGLQTLAEGGGLRSLLGTARAAGRALSQEGELGITPAQRRAQQAANVETPAEAYQRIDQMYNTPQPQPAKSAIEQRASGLFTKFRSLWDQGMPLKRVQDYIYNGTEPAPQDNAYELFRQMAGRSKAAETQVTEDLLPTIQDLTPDERRGLVNWVTMRDNSDKAASLGRRAVSETMAAPLPRVAGETALRRTDRSLAARQRALPGYQQAVDDSRIALSREDTRWQQLRDRVDPQIQAARRSQSGFTQDQYDRAVTGLEAVKDAQARLDAARTNQSQASLRSRTILQNYQRSLVHQDPAVRAEARAQISHAQRLRETAAEAVGAARQDLANLKTVARDQNWSRIAGRYDSAIESHLSAQLDSLRSERASAQIRHETAVRAFRGAEADQRAASRRIGTAQGRLARLQAQVDTARQGQVQARIGQAAINASDAQAGRIFSGDVHAHTEAEDYQALVDAVGPEKAQKIKDAGDQIFAYSKGLRDRLHDAGLITDEVYDNWTQNFPHYIKSEIEDYLAEAEGSRVPTGKPLLTVGQLRNIGLSREGTAAARVNPLNTLIRQTFTVESLARRNEAAQAILKMREQSPVLQDLLKEVHGDYTLKQGERFFSVYENGIQRKFVGPKELSGIWNIDSAQIPTWMRWLQTASGAPLLRAGATGVNAAFIVPNAIRDAQTFMHRTGGFTNPRQLGRSAKELGKAYVDLLAHNGTALNTASALAGGVAGAAAAPDESGFGTRAAYAGAGALAGYAGSEALGRTALRGVRGSTIEDLSRIYRQGGGQFSEFSNLSPEQMINRLTKTGSLGGRVRPVNTEEGLVKTVQNVLGAAKDVASLPFEPVRQLGETVETAPRLAAYRLARQAGKGEQAATQTFRDVTMDFSRAGNFAKTANMFIPFFNATAQAPERFLSMDMGSKKAAAKTLLGIGTAVVAPTIAAETYNKTFFPDDYADVPDYLKDNGWVIMLPGDVPDNPDGSKGTRPFVWIPRPQHLNFIAGAIEREMEHQYGDDHRTWAGTWRSLVGGLLPVNLESVPAPPVVRTAGELMTNKDLFRQREIVPGALQGLPPADQYTDSTSALGRAVGRAINKPPAAVDYAVSSMGGGVGKQLLSASNGLASLLGVDAAEPSKAAPVLDTPIVGESVGSILRRSGGQLTTNAIADLERQANDEKAQIKAEFEQSDWWKKATPKERQAELKIATDKIDRFYALQRRNAREDIAYRK